MDLREKKTLQNIRNAFLQLRAHKPLERITIKELSELAEISKGTFYLHYRDIFDLSAQLQNEVIQDVLDDIIQPDIPLFDMVRLPQQLFGAFHSHQSLIDILFSEDQSAVLPHHIEQSIREYAYQLKPELQSDVRFNTLLAYQVYGSYNAYIKNAKQFGDDQVLDVLDEITAGALQTIKFPQQQTLLNNHAYFEQICETCRI